MAARPRCPGIAFRLFLVAILAVLVGGVLVGLGQQTAAQAPGRVDLIPVDGLITPPMAGFVVAAINDAAATGAEVVVLRLDTPGGLATAMDEIIAAIIASPVPVVVYVGPEGARADSAGVFIAYAAHVAAMAPGTRIGSASPVTIGGAPGGGDAGSSGNDATMARKVTNDAVSQIKNLAQRRGRNAAWAESAVRDAVNSTADEALALGVVDLLASSVPDLLNQINGRRVRLANGTERDLATRGVEIRAIEMGWLEQFLQILADPTIAYILLSLGSVGLFLELANPGAILPGVVGGLFLLLALYALGTLPVNWAGVLLIGFAFLLFAVDLFVPSFGSLTIGGVVSFVLGSSLLVGRDAPPGFAIAPVVIGTMTLLLVASFLLLGASVLRARGRRPATGRESLLGAVGTVRQPLGPTGMVFLRGELWSAVAVDGAAVALGRPVAVVGVDGVRLIVRPAVAAENAAPTAPGEDQRAVVPVAETGARASG